MKQQLRTTLSNLHNVAYDSVVKIMSEVNNYKLNAVGTSPTSRNVSGSACVIEFDRLQLEKLGLPHDAKVPAGKFLLTNAHCVANSSIIWVLLDQEENSYHQARVRWVAHDCDLAILEMVDTKLNLPAMPLGNMPKLRQSIEAVGFPTGGNLRSITEGRVSRIEGHSFNHSGIVFPCVQISAGINHGNSGGPVVSLTEKADGTLEPEIVGIVSQVLAKGQNIAYAITVDTVLHVMQDICRNGEYKGFPGIAMDTKNLTNLRQREYYKIVEPETGVRVALVPEISAAYGKLKTNDILTKIKVNDTEYKIHNDGSVYMYHGKKMSLQHAIFQAFIGDTVEFELIRQGEKLRVSIELDKTILAPIIGAERIYDRGPKFFYVGGALFTALNRQYADSNLTSTIHPNMLNLASLAYCKRYKPEINYEIVILDMVRRTPGSIGYENMFKLVVKEVNGQVINNFDDFRSAIDNNSNPEHIIVTQNNDEIIIKNYSLSEQHDLLSNFKVTKVRDDEVLVGNHLQVAYKQHTLGVDSKEQTNEKARNKI